MRITELPSASKLSAGRFRQLWARPAIWLPSIVAAASLALGAFRGSLDGRLGLVALTAAAVALASAAYTWVFGRDALQRRALTAAVRQAEKEELERLRLLRQELRTDRDPYSTRLVRQLKDSFGRLVPMVMAELDLSTRPTPRRENLDTTAALYESCQRLLQRSLQLWQVAQQVGTEATREELLSQRSQLLQQVEQSIGHLDASLDRLQTAALRDDGATAENQELQEELRIGLETAQRVEERMKALEQELHFHDRMERN